MECLTLGWHRLSVPKMSESMEKLDIKWIVSGSDTDGAVAVFEEIVPPGGGPPRHTHREQLEIFHVIEGEIRFEVSGEVFERGAGDVAAVPAGAVHAFKNIGDQPARIHFELIPALRSEEFFAQLSSGTVADPESYFDEYGMDVAGPPLD